MNQERVFQILMGPHVSEKAAIVADANNQYVFRVALDATKEEIKTPWSSCSRWRLTT
jgi:large subunit ribosomal protein L23